MVHNIEIVVLEHGKNLPLPSYATESSSGMDLMAAISEYLTIAPMQRVLVPTGISIAMQNGIEAQIRPRSGLSLKNGITVLNTPGTIDADYRGEIKVILINLSNEEFVIHPGMRIAQIVFAPVIRANLTPVEKLSATVRGEGGFGSTGVKS